MKPATKEEIFQKIREAQEAMFKVVQHAQTALYNAHVALLQLEDGDIDGAIERIRKCEDCYWEIRRENCENWNRWSMILSHLQRERRKEDERK